jgi:hypothetical protein
MSAAAAESAVVGDPKNYFIVGGAGSGKSHLLRAIVNKLKQVYAKQRDLVVICTAPIGKACTQLHASVVAGREYTATTIHSTINHQLWSKVDAPKRLVLIIDECFLAPFAIWRKFCNKVAKCVANITRTYPGHVVQVQWVLCGDVYQGSAAKEVPLLDVQEFFTWAKQLKFKPLFLTENKRFLCKEYLRLIRALEQRDAATIVPLLQKCYRTTTTGITLACTNHVVDAINKKKQAAYAALPGAVVYSLEGGFTAVRGTYVMVLRNTRDGKHGDFKLTNGFICKLESMVGTERPQINKQKKVFAIDEHLQVDLELPSGEIFTLSSRRLAEDAPVGGGKRKREDAVYEMPLALADAITIYKAQGETYRTDVTVLVAGMFEMSQLYVGLSRGRYLSQLVVPHFDPMHIDMICEAPPHPRIAAWHALVEALQVLI